MSSSSPIISQLAVDARTLAGSWRSPSTWTALLAAAGSVAAAAWPGVGPGVKEVVVAAGSLIVAVWTVVHGATVRHATQQTAQAHEDTRSAAHTAAVAVPAVAATSAPPTVPATVS